MRYAVINAKGESELREWLKGVLKYDDPNLDAWVDEIVSNFDGSYPDAGQSIEVGSFHTKSGNPAVYTFYEGEYDIHEESDD